MVFLSAHCYVGLNWDFSEEQSDLTTESSVIESSTSFDDIEMENVTSTHETPSTDEGTVNPMLAQLLMSYRNAIRNLNQFLQRQKNMNSNEQQLLTATKMSELFFVPIASFFMKKISLMLDLTYDNGDKYDGDIQEGKRHGFGTMFFANGEHYIGSWIQDKRDGYGNLTDLFGRQYSGYWKNDKKHGNGTQVGVTGDSYTGEWVEGTGSGHGVHIWMNGQRYQGEFDNGNLHGYGEYSWPAGQHYTGIFSDGQRNGKGRQRMTSGSYEGDWQKGMIHGSRYLYLE